MKPRSYRYFVGDFETTVYEGQDHTEVWAASLVELYSEDVTIDHSMADFLGRIRRLRTSAIVYFHNLKFDGSFLIDHLLHSGWTFNRVPEKDMRSREFKCAISDRGAWYTITLKWGHQIIEFRDSLKLLPFSVKQIGSSFQTKHQKLEMDYEGYRFAGCDITAEEREYIANDVLVVKEALEYMFEEGHDKLTIGSCCMAEFKKGFDKLDLDNFFPDLTKVELDPQVYGAENADRYIRKSYRGGYCYLVKGKENKRLTHGWTADANSSYSSNMSSQSGNVYPVGKPSFWKGDIPEVAKREDMYYFVRFKCRFQIKEGMLPTVQIKGNLLYPATDYLTTSDIYDYETGVYKRYYTRKGELHEAKLTMTMTCTDFELFKKHYDIYDLELLDGCYFYTEIGLFDEYMSRYKKIKETSKGAKRTLAKLYLNNLYGKFASNDDSSYKKPYLNEKGIVAFEVVEEHEKQAGHIAVGSAITSYARRFVIQPAQANYYGAEQDGFVYCDTDSVHCSGKPEDAKGIKVHPTEFCCWKMESTWDEAVFVRQKTYIEHVVAEDGEPVEPYYNIRCAGMGETAKQEFIREHVITDFAEGLELDTMLKPRRMRGGIVLENKGFKMKQKVHRSFISCS